MHTNRSIRSSFYRLAVITLFAAIVVIAPAVSSGYGFDKGGGGSGSNPKPTPTPVPVNQLPQAAPAVDILYRESFGLADASRPTGTKGVMKDAFLHISIAGFWIEYPGNKNNNWIAADSGQTWRFCGASENPYEMFSPIQMTFGFYGNGCLTSAWTDNPTTNPVALMPVSLPNAPYEVSLNGRPAPLPGQYLALGLTNSTVKYSNLSASASVVLVTRVSPTNIWGSIDYELRAGGMNGTLLASGQTYFDSWSQIKLRVDPVARTVGGSINGTDLGIYPLNIGKPLYAGFEGVGIADNFIVRTAE